MLLIYYLLSNISDQHHHSYTIFVVRHLPRYCTYSSGPTDPVPIRSLFCFRRAALLFSIGSF